MKAKKKTILHSIIEVIFWKYFCFLCENKSQGSCVGKKKKVTIFVVPFITYDEKIDQWNNQSKFLGISNRNMNETIFPLATYVDDLNLIETPKELTKTTKYLTKDLKWNIWDKQTIVSACILNIVQIMS